MKVLSGKSLTSFTVTGQAFQIERRRGTVNCTHTENVQAETERFAVAQLKALEQLQELRDTAVCQVGKQLAKIFDIHMVLTLDDDFGDAIKSIIKTQHVNAEYAVSLTAYNFSKVFAAMNDAYMKARAADIHDISDRLVSILSGRRQISAKDLATGANKIICSEDFLPSEIIQFCENNAQCFLKAFGSSESHSAILAKSLDIPVIVGLGWDLLNDVRTGDNLTVDGKDGKVTICESRESFVSYDSKLRKAHRAVLNRSVCVLSELTLVCHMSRHKKYTCCCRCIFYGGATQI